MLVVLESTTYPGTTEEVVQPLLERERPEGGRDFFLAFSPERVDPGNPTFQTRNVPKVVGGSDARRARRWRLRSTERPIDTVVPVSSTRVAEMVKLLENTFRAVNIGLVNELALMCDRLGIDVWEVVDAATTKPFGFMPFYPGPGLGGHCIPIDPFYLSWKARQSGFEARFIELAGHVNGAMPHFVVDKVAEALNTQRKAVNGARDPRRRRRLQARHRRHPRVAGARRHAPAPAEGRPGPSTRIRMCRAAGEQLAGCTRAAERSITADALRWYDCVVVVTDHRAFDYRQIVAARARRGLAQRHRGRAPHVFRLGAPANSAVRSGVAG